METARLKFSRYFYSQLIEFAIESTIVYFFAGRFLKVKRRAEINERAARKALEDRQLFAALIENSSDFISITNKDGKLVYINPAGRRMVGLSMDCTLKDTRLLDYYPESERATVFEIILNALVKDGQWRGETFLRNVTTQQVVPVSDTHFKIYDFKTGEILGVGTVSRDISEVKRVSGALRRSEAELREAQRVAQVGSWSWNAKTDTVEWSEELFRIYDQNLDLPALAYDDFLKLHTPGSRKELDCAVKKTLLDGTSYELELESIRPDGSVRWVCTRGEPVRASDGTIMGLRGTAQDVTSLKELQRLREEWTSIIAHDLRQPIGVISSSAELLPKLHIGAMNEMEKTTGDRIQNAAGSLARMVDDMLDFSRLEAAHFVLVRHWSDPRSLVKEALERFSRVIPEFRYRLEEIGEISLVYVDRMRVEQVLGNLISNAVKYGKKGSEIRVRLKQVQDEVEVSVTNEGRGISADDIPKMFNRFWRSQKSRSSGIAGLGLGLYISKGIVEAHGGKIWVTSIPERTTAFYFTLPTRAASEKGAA